MASADDDYFPSEIFVTLYAGPSVAGTIALDLVTRFRPPLATPLFKWSRMAELIDRHQWKSQTERVLQTYELPIARFLAANADLDLSNLTALQVTFDGGEGGSILIDQVGFRSR